jgi:hypothetical protein
MLTNVTLRRHTILSLLIVVPLGLLSKKYIGPAHEWVNDYLGDVLYEVFWCLFIFLLIPTRKALRQIPVWVFGVTCAIEFLQLWNQPALNSFRYTLLGKLLLGSSFDWLDFPHYVLGSIIGWLWLRQIARFHDSPPKPRQ